MATKMVFLSGNSQVATELWSGAFDLLSDDGIHQFDFEFQSLFFKIDQFMKVTERPRILIINMDHPLSGEVVEFFRDKWPRLYIIGITQDLPKKRKDKFVNAYCSRDRIGLAEVLKGVLPKLLPTPF